MRGTVVGHRVRGHNDGRSCLGDRIADRGGGDVVVVRGCGQAPGVAGVGPGSGMGRSERHHSDRGARFTVHTGDRSHRRRMRGTVVGHRVGGNRNRRVGLADRQRLLHRARCIVIRVTGLIGLDNNRPRPGDYQGSVTDVPSP